MEEAVTLSGPRIGDTLAYCFDAAVNLVTSRSFRVRVLRSIVSLYKSVATPDFLSLARCYQFLDDADSVAALVAQLLRHNQQVALPSPSRPPPPFYPLRSRCTACGPCRTQSSPRTKSALTCTRTTTKSS